MAAAATADSSVGAAVHHSAYLRPRKYLLSAREAISSVRSGSASVISVMLDIASRLDRSHTRRTWIENHLHPGEFIKNGPGIHLREIGVVGGHGSHVRQRFLELSACEHLPH